MPSADVDKCGLTMSAGCLILGRLAHAETVAKTAHVVVKEAELPIALCNLFRLVQESLNGFAVWIAGHSVAQLGKLEGARAAAQNADHAA